MKNKIKKILIIESQNAFAKQEEVLVVFENDDCTLMNIDDCIKLLSTYTFANRFKTARNLFNNIETTHMVFKDFYNSKEVYRYYDSYTKASSIKRDKERHLQQKLEKALNIDMKAFNQLNAISAFGTDDPNAWQNNMESVFKVQSKVLEECQKNQIVYEKDPNKIIEKILKTLSIRSETNLEKYADGKELETYIQNKLQDPKTDKDYLASSLSFDVQMMHEYISIMLDESYTLIRSLIDKKMTNRSEVLKEFAEYTIVFEKYLELEQRIKQYISYINKLDKSSKLEELTNDSKFMAELEELITHNDDETLYYHGTPSRHDAENILEKGLFLNSDNILTTTFGNLSLKEILSYQYGDNFNKVGDYMIVIKGPKEEDVVRETTDIEKRENNNIAARRLGLMVPVNKYIVEPQYIVGIIDKVEHVIIKNPEVYTSSKKRS